MHRAKLKRIVACVLAFVIFLTGSQFDLFAHAAGDPPYIKKELEQYRTEFSKTYLKSDGGLESVVSPSALHFKNEKGEWEEIDQTLVLKTEDGQKVYETKNSPMTVRFPAELNSSDTGVTLEAEGHKIVVELLDNKNSKASKKEEEKQSERSGRPKSKMIASELLEQEVTDSSAIEYADVYSGADLRYDTTAGILKESVIIKDRQNGNRTYRYNITADGLELRLEPDGRVEFYEPSSAEPVFTMPAPLMFDAKEEYSYDIDVKLKQKKGVYELSYTPDKDWLNDQERVYPVTLDPSIVVNSGIEDSYTYSADSYQNTCLGFEQQLKVGSSIWQGDNDTFDTYIKFKDLPQIPMEDYKLESALLMVTPKGFVGTWEEMEIGAYEVTGSWNNDLTGQSGSRLCYSNRPATSDTAFSTATFVRGDTAAGGFEVANLVKKWYNNSGTNYGVKLSATTISDDPWDSITFHSSRSDTGRPYLSITYKPAVTDITITNRPANDRMSYGAFDIPYHLTCEFGPEGAAPEEVVWESSNTDVADISSDGTVWPNGFGTTEISVRLLHNSAIYDSFTLTVYRNELEKLTITGRPENDELQRLQTCQLGAEATPSNATDWDYMLSWSSSNTDVATVDSNGLVTATGFGSTIITARSWLYGITDSFLLTVPKVDITAVNIYNTPDNNLMSIGQTRDLAIVIEPLNATQIANFTSSNTDESVYSQFLLTVVDVGGLAITNLPEISDFGAFHIMHPNSTHQLSVEGAQGLPVTWSSSDNSVATVSSSGLITALKEGEVTISAEAGGRTSYCYIYVSNITGIKIDNKPADGFLGVGETFDLSATIQTINGSYQSKNVHWYSSDEDVATIDFYVHGGDGYYVYGRSEGVATITVWSEHQLKKDTFTVYVGQIPAKSVTIKDKLDNPLYYKGDVITLRALLDPVNAYNKRILWRSSNTDVAVIREYNGYVQVTVVGAGTATISATWAGDSSIKDEYTIYTIIPVTGVKISNRPPNSRMTVGTKHKVTANVLPANATYTEVLWDSKNENVASIDEYGNITALAPGSSVITVTSVGDTRFTDTFTLTVVNPSVSGVTITNKNQNTITVDDVRTYTATVTPSNADNKAVKWISTKENVASINPNTGKLTALSAGTTVIRAVSVSNSAKYDEFTLTVKNPTEYDGHRIGKFITPENPYAIEAQEHSKAVYKTEAATSEHYEWYQNARLTVTGGHYLHLVEACALLNHFLDNTGEEIQIALSLMINENKIAKENTINHINKAINTAEYFYKYYNNFDFTTINEVVNNKLSYSSKEENAINNWYQAINSYRIWYSCSASVKDGQYEMSIDYNLRDFYDWNPEITNHTPLVSQAEMYALHCVGLAKDFKVTGKVTIKVTWKKGERIGSGAEWKMSLL